MTHALAGAGLRAPADAVLGAGEALPAGPYWLQPKSAIVLEAAEAPLGPPDL